VLRGWKDFGDLLADSGEPECRDHQRRQGPGLSTAGEWRHDSERLGESDLHAVSRGARRQPLPVRTASDKSVLGLKATQLRDELSVYTKAPVNSLLSGKANAGHTHGISLYTEPLET